MEHDKSDPGDVQDGFLSSVPIDVTVSVGRAKPMVRDLLTLEKDTVLLLDKHLDDPVELYVGDRLIGIGLLEVEGGEGHERLAVRVLDVVPVKVAQG